jgi:hypothetical protein
MMISEYLIKLEAALRSNPRPYFPMDKERRKRSNLRLGRGIGYGLGPYEDWETWARTTYSRFVVANSFDSVGVVLDNKEWMAAIREGVQEYKDYKVPV